MSDIQIPVLPYVGKYLAGLYPKGYVLSETDPIGEMLIQLLRASKQYKRFENYLSRYSSQLTVIVPIGKSLNGVPSEVTEHTIIRFNTFMEGHIRVRMYDFVDFCRDYRVMKKAAAIREFMVKHGFTEDDIAFETLLKAYQRHEWRQEMLIPEVRKTA